MYHHWRPIADMLANVSHCSLNLTALPHTKALCQSILTLHVHQEKRYSKLVHCCTALSIVCNFDVHDHNTSSDFVLKQAVKLNGFT